MAQVSAAEMAAGKTFAAFFDRTEIRFVETGFHADGSPAREGRAVARPTRRQAESELVPPARRQSAHWRGRPHPQRVTRRVRRQKRLGHLDGPKISLFRLPDAPPANGVTIEFHPYDGLRTFL